MVQILEVLPLMSPDIHGNWRLEDDLRLDMGIARLDAKSCWNMALHLWVPNGSNWPNWSYRLVILVEVLFLDDRFMLTRFGVTSMKRNWWCKDPTFPRYMRPILELTMEVRMFLHLNLGSHAVSELNVPKPSKTWFSDVFWWFLQVKKQVHFLLRPKVWSPMLPSWLCTKFGDVTNKI